MLSCAVIGCGAAGMAACAALRQCGLLVTCFDVAPQPGGVWSRSAHCTTTVRGLPSPIYPAMRSALPKDLLAFSDLRYAYVVAQYPHHTAVQHYLTRYAAHTDVCAMTRFNTKVEAARYDAHARTWRVTTVNVCNGDIMQWAFDRVCVCSGHAHAPRWPAQLRKVVLRAYADAGGAVLHASQVKDFRAWRGKRVVVLGDGLCARDYCAELCSAGAHVYHCASASPLAETAATVATTTTPATTPATTMSATTPTTTLAATAMSAALHVTPSSSLTRRVVARLAHVALTPPSVWRQRGAVPATSTTPSGVVASSASSSSWYRRADLAAVVPVGYPLRSDGRGIVFAPAPGQQPSWQRHCRHRHATAAPRSTTTSTAADTHANVASSTAHTHACRDDDDDAADGVLVDNIAGVICATGYVQHFAFLEPTLRRAVEALANGAHADTQPPPLRLMRGQADASHDSLTCSSSSNNNNNNNNNEDEGSAKTDTAARLHDVLLLGTVCTQLPSLAFVGLQRGLLPPNLLFEAQARLVAFAFTQRLPHLLPTSTPDTAAASAALTQQQQQQLLLRHTPQLLHALRDNAGTMALHSALYYNVLQDALGVRAPDTFATALRRRWYWLLLSSLLRLMYTCRSWAPLPRKRQHLLFSNDV